MTDEEYRNLKFKYNLACDSIRILKEEKAEAEEETLKYNKALVRSIDLIQNIVRIHNEKCKWCTKFKSASCITHDQNADCNFNLDIKKYDMEIVRNERH